MIEIAEAQNQTPVCEAAGDFLSTVKARLDAEPSMFVQPKFLHEIGIFGSHSAATHAVQNGAMPHVKVSPYRVLIPKEAVLAFLKGNYHGARVSA